MNILMTGSASHLASAILPMLCQLPAVKQITGIDIKASGFHHAKFSEHLMDIRSDRIDTLMQQADVLIHMAFVVQAGTLGRQRNNATLIHDININGSINVFKSAQRHRLRHIIHLSSASVYGGSSTPCMYNEYARLQAVPGLLYSAHKIAVEQWLDEFECANTTTVVTRLRPHLILGQRCQPLLRAFFRSAWCPQLGRPGPMLQCVWEQDVGNAIVLALTNPQHGCFNLSGDECTSLYDMKRTIHDRVYSAPFTLITELHRLGWWFGGRYGDPAWINAMRMHICVSNHKALEKLDWRPTLNLRECLEKTVE